MKGLAIITALYLVFCFSTYKQFGITSDEYVEYQSGKALLHYYQTKNEYENFDIEDMHLPTNSTYFRGHLALFAHLNPSGDYERFHLFNMLSALPIFLAFYVLFWHVYKSSKLATLGTLALFLTPRFLGDIPANTKDVPFAVLFFVSLGLIYFFDKTKFNTFAKILILGILLGFTTSFRLLGVSLFIIYFLYSLKGPKAIALRNTIFILLIAAAILTLSLPLLSNNFLEGFKTLIAKSASFDYWNNKMLFMGKFITREERPWYYLPLWLVITTPLYILLPFLISPLVLYLKKSRDSRLYQLMYLAIGINLALYMLIKPVIYNGLRHFLFLVPIITFVAVLTIFDLWELLKRVRPAIKYAFLALFVFLFGGLIKDFTGLHPYQYVYFNEVTNGLKGAQGKFDSDYWGTSYKQSTAWATEQFAKAHEITIYSSDMPFAESYYSRELFQQVFDAENADYILCDIDNALQKDFDLPIVYKIERDGVPLNVVLDNRRERAGAKID